MLFSEAPHPNVIDKVGWVPIYLKDLYFEKDKKELFKSSNELEELQRLIASQLDVLDERSCRTMDAIVFPGKTNRQDTNLITFKVSYMEFTYQETENVQEFSFESFFSALGGFIGTLF